MGIHNYDSTTTDAKHLSCAVGRLREQLDRTIAQLSEARDRLPGTDEARRALEPADDTDRRDLSNLCISLELALTDTRKWLGKVVERTAHAGPPAQN